MSKLMEKITESTRLNEIDAVTPQWEWHGSPEDETVAVGHLRDKSAGYLPVMATIKEREENNKWESSKLWLVLNYNGSGCRKVITPEKVSVAASRSEVEAWAEGEGYEEYIEDSMAVIDDQIQDGEMVETRDDAIEEIVSFAQGGEWYERLSDMDKMEVS